LQLLLIGAFAFPVVLDRQLRLAAASDRCVRGDTRAEAVALAPPPAANQPCDRARALNDQGDADVSP